MTRKRVQMLAFIQARMPHPGQPPSYREIAAYQGVAVCAACQHARPLERKGPLSSESAAGVSADPAPTSQCVRIVGKVIGMAMWPEPQKRLERLPARHVGPWKHRRG